MHRRASLLVVLLLMASISSVISSFPHLPENEDFNSVSSSKAVTTWSGVVQLQSSYTVQSSDELRVLAGTSIEMSIGSRL